MDWDILRYHNNIIMCNLLMSDLSLQHAQGSLVSTHIGVVAVELRQDREEKARVR